jgi:hypothetical protein
MKISFIFVEEKKKATRRNGWPLTIACHMKKKVNSAF